MKLTFRGCSYTAPDPIQTNSDSTEQPKIKLIYRSLTYYIDPPAVMDSETVATDEPTVTLVYRGNTYERKLQLPQPYQRPSAINWRYQTFEKS
jgi:hypothetical protein